MQKPSWQQHNQQVSKIDLSASAPLKMAFEQLTDITDKFFAADLGCGSGIDTLAMLDKGWNVLATDIDEHSIELLKKHACDNRLKVAIQSFEELSLPSLDLVNASMALPFCSPSHFPACWDNITQSIKTHGIFCGHFFGINDSWAQRPGMNFISRKDFNILFQKFELLWTEEIEKDGKTISGATKHWHIFSVVARKIMP